MVKENLPVGIDPVATCLRKMYGGDWERGRGYMDCIGTEEAPNIFSVGITYRNTITGEKILVEERTIEIPNKQLRC